jgi:hypothetical protein
VASVPKRAVQLCRTEKSRDDRQLAAAADAAPSAAAVFVDSVVSHVLEFLMYKSDK